MLEGVRVDADERKEVVDDTPRGHLQHSVVQVRCGPVQPQLGGVGVVGRIADFIDAQLAPRVAQEEVEAQPVGAEE